MGAVESSVALGLLAGSVLTVITKPVKKKARFVFAACAFVFSGNMFLSLFLSPAVWCAASFLSYAAAAVMNANLTTIMREKVPVELQGRVFSAEDTLKNCTIPLGLFLGGILADGVFEPFMENASPVQEALAVLFGSGSGAGIAFIFFCAGVIGMVMCLAGLRRPVYKELDT